MRFSRLQKKCVCGGGGGGVRKRVSHAEGGWRHNKFKGSFIFLFFLFLIVCFTSYFVFSIAVLPHSPGVVYYHLLLRRETRILT